MNLMFWNGEKLYDEEKKLRQYGKDVVNKYCGVNLHQYQKQILDIILDRNKKEFNIYGDDFKIEIIPKNEQDDCVLTIKDYDENQKFENEIIVTFSKDELAQFISLLETVRSKM